MQLPSVETVNEARVSKFLEKITTALGSSELGMFRELIERYEREHNVPAAEIAAALAKVVQGDTPLLLEPPRKPEKPAFEREFVERPGGREASRTAREPRAPRPDTGPRDPDVGMETFRIEVGYVHGVQPGDIVGAIANEADLESKFIGRIDIRDDYSLVDLPEGMPRELLEHLKKVRVGGQPIRIRRAEDADMTAAPPRAKRPFGAKPPGNRPGGFKPGGPRKGPPRRDPR